MTSISGFMANSYSYLSSNAGQKSAAPSKSDSNPASSEKVARQAQSKDAPAPGSLASAAITAREKIDAGYAKLGTTGTSRTTADEWDAIGFPDFDRKMLYAVKSNEGGKFTAVEVNAAKNEIANRVSDIINANDPLADNGLKADRAVLRFLDAASDEEKASFDWAVARASVQKSYMLGGGTANVGSGDRVVDKLVQAWNQVIASGGNSNDFPNMPAYQEARIWWAQDHGSTPRISFNV